MSNLQARLSAFSPERLKGIRRGIEKESLRATPQGGLALTPHPLPLGSALTHPHITTDYSEAQLELITGVHPTPETCLEELMQMLTQRLSLLFEFAPPDFYERSTFAAYIDTLLETGLVSEDTDGTLHLHERTRTWERYVERLLPADAVLAIQRVAVEHAPMGTPDVDAKADDATAPRPGTTP